VRGVGKSGWLQMNISGREWKQLFDLLDEYLDQSAAGRSALLARIANESPELKVNFDRLLAEHARLDAVDSAVSPPGRSGEVPAEPRGRFVRSVALDAGAEVGPYRLVREIGHGGMSTVWLAARSDGQMRREVALKLPHMYLHRARFIDRFARERDILSTLSHPNIARLYDAGVSADGQPYLAMEYIEGTPLIASCNARRLKVRERAELFLQVLDAVQFAHAHLVIHRDIKPSNILVNSQGQVSLLDFGIAKLLVDGEARETELTQFGGRVLTPDFASPEQIRGEALGTASDAYSLGVVLYELVSGERPYKMKRDSRAALEEAILAIDAPKPSQTVQAAQAQACATTQPRLVKALRGDLDTIVLKALKKLPAERYPTINAFAEDIVRYLHGEPVLAQPDSAWYRTRKFIGRNKLAVASTAAVAIASAVGLGAVLWQARIAHEQRFIAEREATHARAEAAKATVEAKKAAAIKDFLLGIFDANDPKAPVARKPSELTAREILDEGRRRIAGSLDDQPETKHEILLALGGLYDEIGLPDKAINLCRDAAAIAQKVMGQNAEAMADALRCVALAQEQGDRRAAEETIAKAEAALASAGDRSSLLYAQVQTIKASLLRQYGSQRRDELLGILKNVIPIWQQRYPSDEGHLVAWAYLANAHWDMGDRVEAVRAADQAIAAARAGSGGQMGLADAYFTRAQYENKLGDYVPAEADYREASGIYAIMLGDRHPRTLRNNCLLGRVLHAQGNREAGIRLLVQSTDDMEKALPSSDALTICFEQLGYAYIEEGRADKAEKLFAKAGAIFEHLGDKLFQTNAELGVAQALEFRGRYGEARRLALDAIAVRKENQSQTASLPAAYLRLAQIELHDGRLDAAGALLDRVLSTDRAGGDPLPLPQDNATAESMRAELMRLQGDDAGAIERSEAALAFLRSQRVPMAALLEAATLSTEGSALCDIGQAKRGLEAVLRSLNILESRHQASSPYLADAEAASGMCLLRLGRRDDARVKLLRAEAILAANTGLGEHFRRPVRVLDARLRQPD